MRFHLPVPAYKCTSILLHVFEFYFQIMKEAGINLFPAEDSSKYVSIQNKVNKAFAVCHKYSLLKNYVFIFSLILLQ